MPSESETRAGIERTAVRIREHVQKTGQSISHTEARDRARAAVVRNENKKARR